MVVARSAATTISRWSTIQQSQQGGCRFRLSPPLSLFFSTTTTNNTTTNMTETTTSPTVHTHFALILGKPGGGKGTISGKILKDFPQFYHLSSGDKLRRHVQDQTDLGKEAQSYMDSGALVPDRLMMDLILTEAKAPPECDQFASHEKSILLDGFPRTLPQAQALDELFHVDLVVNLDIPTQVIIDRIADRWIHPASGRVYSYSYKPPKEEGKDDVTGEPLIQRPDDDPEKVRSRLEAYEQATAPLIDYYTNMGVLETFSGTMSDVIYPKVKKCLETKFF